MSIISICASININLYQFIKCVENKTRCVISPSGFTRFTSIIQDLVTLIVFQKATWHLSGTLGFYKPLMLVQVSSINELKTQNRQTRAKCLMC